MCGTGPVLGLTPNFAALRGVSMCRDGAVCDVHSEALYDIGEKRELLSDSAQNENRLALQSDSVKWLDYL